MAVQNTVEALIVGKFIDQISAPANQAFDKLQSAAKAAASALLAYVSFDKIKSSIESTMDEAAQAELAVSKIEGAMKAAGEFTTEYSKYVQDLATEFQNLSRESDESIIAINQLFVTFGAKRENLDALTQATLNLSEAMGRDLQGAGQMMARAMEGNFIMFGKMGITVNETGTQAEKMNQLMDILSRKFEGQALIASQTFTGTLARLSNAFSDLLEAEGNLIIKSPLVHEMLEKKIKKYQDLKAAIEGSTKATEFSLNAIAAYYAAWGTVKFVLKGALVGVELLAAGLSSLASGLADMTIPLAQVFDYFTGSKTAERAKEIAKGFSDMSSALADDAIERSIDHLKEVPEVLNKTASAAKRADAAFKETRKSVADLAQEQKDALYVLGLQRDAEAAQEKALFDWREKSIKQLMDDREESDKQEWDGITKINTLRDESWNRQMELQRQLLADRDAATQKEIDDALYIDSLQWEIDKEHERRGKEITDSLRTETEIYSDAVNRLAEAYNNAVISAETFKRGVEAAHKKMSEMDKISQDLSHVVGTAFEDAIIGGKKFSDILKGLQQDLIRLALRAAIIKPMQNWLEGAISGDSGGSSLGFLSGLFSGGATSGASTTAITEAAFLAGDRRGTTVVMNISTPDVNGFVRNQGAILNNMNQAVRRGARNS